MCGIVGLHQPAAPIDAERFARMRDAMTHRGPDAAGAWISADGRLALGHRRLAILDLSAAGAQPMERDGLRIVFNGEIYNHAELRSELHARGCAFSSRSDTEVLLAAYRTWGEDCLARLDGMFAFCIHDEARRRLFLARDRAGEKPLFVARSPGRLAFASELKALFADPAQPRRFDHAGLNAYLAYGFVPGAGCLVVGIAKLPAAHAATYDLDNGAWRQWRWWDIPEPERTPADASELSQRLEALLEASVRRQLVADVPVGILLSGGLDSALVTALASRCGGEVRTFTVSFPGHGQTDESPFAAIVADHFATRHTVLPADAAQPDLLPQLARHYDEPLADSSMIPTYLVSKLIRAHATVALGGDGGDELFGGYGHYAWMQRHANARRWLPGAARCGVAALATALLPVGSRGRNYLRALAGPLPAAYGGVNHFFNPQDRRLLLGKAFTSDGAPEASKAAACSPAHGIPGLAMVADFRTYLCDDILVKVDRASMLASLEVRAPFLSRELIEFAYRVVPDALRVHDGRCKVLLKNVGRRILPQKLNIERKQGFGIPIAAWLTGPWGKILEDAIRGAPAWLLSATQTARLLDGQRRGRHNGERIFALGMLELWRREYGVDA